MVKLSEINLHWDLINYLIEFGGYTNYLEIGIDRGTCFRNIRCSKKTGVDPESHSGLVDFKMTSNEFFKICTDRYDLIFIDGDHAEEAVFHDILQSLQILKPNGMIVTHDTLPLAWESTLSNMGSFSAWKAFARLRMGREDLAMFAVLPQKADDTGCGIITHGRQRCASPRELNRAVFDDTKAWFELMNYVPLHKLQEALSGVFPEFSSGRSASA